MKINSVEIENFLSVQKSKIDFDSFEGLVRVVGLNEDTEPVSSNGAGKSSIIEAVVFALFGKTIRKTTEKSVTNSQSKGICKVKLVVNDDVTITRTKKPPSLIVDVGGENCTKEGILYTQQYLEKILNTNYHVFLASIVFGQQNSINFLSSTPEEKRAIIQNFLNVTDLFKHRSKIRSLKATYNGDKKVASTLQAESLQKVNSIKKRIKKIKSDIGTANNLLTKEKMDFLNNHSLSEIQEIEAKRLELEVGETSVAGRITTMESRIGRLKKDITYYQDNSYCEHCHKLPRALYDRLQDSEQELQKSYQKRLELRSERNTYRSEIENVHVPISAQDYEIITGIDRFKVEESVLRKQLRSQQRLSRKYSYQMAEAQKGYDLMRFWETAFSEQGLVKYIIRNVLDYFNERSNFYLGVLAKGSFSIEFDDSLTETIKAEKRVVFFDALSGGEKKKVSLAVMLALNDLLVLSGKDRSNLLFFDEIADSLDREGVKGLYELIHSISENKKLFIITHNEYFTSLIEDDAEILSVNKKEGLSSFAYDV